MATSADRGVWSGGQQRRNKVIVNDWSQPVPILSGRHEVKWTVYLAWSRWSGSGVRYRTTPVPLAGLDFPALCYTQTETKHNPQPSRQGTHVVTFRNFLRLDR
ncbi:hypothetical protein Bbelb_441660 [Branchiostoma belcheri]|nr:hypothetical protein Bbelb_441660 [Branchiostoma belcheri]